MRKEYKFKTVVSGSKPNVEKAIGCLDTLHMTGHEDEDRLLIQQAIDENDLRASVLYNGNFVWPMKRLMKEYARYNKSGSIENLTDFFYDFLYLGCDDIAHYSKNGYIDYYDGDFARVKRDVVFASRVPGWHTDLLKVLEAMKQFEQPVIAETPRVRRATARVRHLTASTGERDGQRNEQLSLFGWAV